MSPEDQTEGTKYLDDDASTQVKSNLQDLVNALELTLDDTKLRLDVIEVELEKARTRERRIFILHVIFIAGGALVLHL